MMPFHLHRPDCVRAQGLREYMDKNSDSRAMKRIFGLILLALTVLFATNIAKKISAGDSGTARTGDAAYDAGKKAGGVLAIAVTAGLGLLGLRLLFSGD